MKQFWPYVMGAVLLAGCASPAPIRFHTLDAGMADEAGTVTADPGQPPLRFEVMVTVPERLNRDNIVLARRVVPVADTSLQVLEDQRWESVFGDALRDALAARLAHEVAARQQAAAVAGARDEVVDRVGERAEVSAGHGLASRRPGLRHRWQGCAGRWCPEQSSGRRRQGRCGSRRMPVCWLPAGRMAVRCRCGWMYRSTGLTAA